MNLLTYNILLFIELAAAFLHENGILLHYDDHLRELNNYFFIDPHWLCNIMASVVTVTQKNSYVLGGKISRKNLIKSSNLTEQFIPQVNCAPFSIFHICYQSGISFASLILFISKQIISTSFLLVHFASFDFQSIHVNFNLEMKYVIVHFNILQILTCSYFTERLI